MSIIKIGPFVPYDSNVYLVTGDHPIIVDAGTGIASSQIISEIRRFSKVDPEMLIATHCHFDHIGGAPDLVEEFGCGLYSGAGDADFIRSGDPAYTVSNIFGSRSVPMECHVLTSDDVISTGEHSFRIIETPGHTPGGICLYEDETGYLISGDTLFFDGFGRTDFPGGSMSQLRSSLSILSNIDIRGLFPGHGNACDHYDSEILSGVLRMAGV